MNDAQVEQLIQMQLDGTTTPADDARLREELTRNRGARARYEELASVFEALRSARREPAPAGLRENVMRAIRSEAGVRGLRLKLRPGLPRPALARVALPFAAGFAAGALVWAALAVNIDGGRDAKTVGTMGAMRGVSPAGRTLAVGGALRAALRTDPAGVGLILEASDPVEVSVRSDAGSLEVTGFLSHAARAGFHNRDGGCFVSLGRGARVELALHPGSPEARALHLEARASNGSTTSAIFALDEATSSP